MRVLVTDAYERKSVAAVRHLGRRGCHVAAGGVKRWEQSFFSKYCRERVLYPNPVNEPEAFTDFLLDHLRHNRFDFVLPMSCYTTVLVSRRKDEFSKLTSLAVPDYQLLQRVRDKAAVAETARRLGIGVPETFAPRSLDEVRQVAGRITYPCVLKYRRGTGSLGIRYPRSPDELIEAYSTPAHNVDVVFDDPSPIVQEYAPGTITDVCCLFNRGRARAAEIHRRTRTYPPSGGWGVAYLTVDEPELRSKALRLLEEVGWHGPGLVEFKVDPRTGQEKLMEVNTRFWGGLDVSRRAGVDFAWLACRMAVDGDVEPVWDYRVGMRYRFAFSSELKSILAGGDRLETLLDYLTLRRGTATDLCPEDPLPQIVNAAVAAYAPARRTLARLFGDHLPGRRK